MKHKYVLSKIKEAITGMDPDIVFLQEVVGSTSCFRKKKYFPSESQFEYLADGIWKHLAYGKNAVTEKRHHGNVILSKYPILKSSNLNISVNRFEKRGLLHAVISLDGNEVHLMSIHLNLMEKARKLQIEKINKYISLSTEPRDKIILAGDFNDWRERVTKALAKKNHFKEAFYELNHEHAKTFPSFAPLLALDRIYFKNMTVNSVNVIKNKIVTSLSDHLAVYAEFQI